MMTLITLTENTVEPLKKCNGRKVNLFTKNLKKYIIKKCRLRYDLSPNDMIFFFYSPFNSTDVYRILSRYKNLSTENHRSMFF